MEVATIVLAVATSITTAIAAAISTVSVVVFIRCHGCDP
jgi:hypothetical protein